MRRITCAAVLAATAALSAQPPRPFQIEETTIADIQSALRGGTLTCRTLVERYLARIEANDLTALLFAQGYARKDWA